MGLEEKQTLKKWFGTCRLTYNRALAFLKSVEYKTAPYCWRHTWLRNRFCDSCNIPNKLRFLEDTPKHIRDYAVRDLVNAYASNFAKRQKNPNHTFDISYKKKKDVQTITIEYTAIKMLLQDNTDSNNYSELKMYPRVLKGVLRYCLRNMPVEKITYDCRLQMDRIGRIFLCVPYRANVRENQADFSALSNRKVVALDPGVRTFLTAYDPSGSAFKFGHKDIIRIKRLAIFCDRLISKRDKCKFHRRKRRLRKALLRMTERIQNKVRELHRKVTIFLVSNYDDIILPPFETQKMISKSLGRRIKSDTARNMLTLSHYRFRQWLLYRVNRYNEERCSKKTVHVLTEEYTSKTCSHCGNIKDNLGGAEMYRCTRCGVWMDRDANGARNILLKNIRTMEELPGDQQEIVGTSQTKSGMHPGGGAALSRLYPERANPGEVENSAVFGVSQDIEDPAGMERIREALDSSDTIRGILNDEKSPERTTHHEGCVG